MLLILPLLCFVLMLTFFRRVRPCVDPRAAFLWASVAWGLFTAAMTETLSVFSALTTELVALSWGVGTLVTALLAARLGTSGQALALPRRQLPSPRTAALTLCIGVIVLITGLLAMVGWPNEGDSFRYHLSRVAHWAQNQSVAFYSTHILNQLYLPPWAEYAVLQIRLLGGDDRLAQLVQWFSMLGSLAGVSLIARELGAPPRGQLFSALFCVTLPMGILQASSTQNDYVVAFWLVCLAYALLTWPARSASVWHSLGIGAGLGLAVLTKPTASIFAAPLLLFVLVARRSVWSPTMLRQAGAAGLLALALNAPQFARNFELFGSIVGPTSGSPSYPAAQVSAAFSPPLLASNLIRNATLHLGTPFPVLNSSLLHVIGGWHTWLGIDVNDPRSTWQPAVFPFAIPSAPGDEATAGNPVHLLLIIIAGLTVATSRQWRADTLVWRYALALLLGYVLLCLVFKWRPFGSHWQLSLFVLWAPVVGLVWQRHARWCGLAALIMAVWAMPFLLKSQSHPLLGERSVLISDRVDQYLRHNPAARARYVGSTDFLRSLGCAQVGLVLPPIGLEYPFWALLPEVSASQGRLEHVAVSNVSQSLAARAPPFVPCAIVAVGKTLAVTITLGEHVYHLAWSSDGIEIFTNGREIPVRPSDSATGLSTRPHR